MNTPSSDSGPTLGNLWGLDTWNRERSDEELREFVTQRHERLADVDIL